MEPRMIPADERRSVSLYDVDFQYAVTGDRSGGGLAVLEVTIPPKTLVKPHRHSREDEFSYVVSGEIGCRLGDRTVEVLPAGSALIKPRDVPHALWNVSDLPARILEIVMPAGIEGYFEELAPILRESGPEWTQRYGELTARYGLEIVDEWTDELEQRYGINL